MLGRLRCTLGRHSWERRVNPEQGGKSAVYFACRRCGKEKTDYGEPSGPAMGLGGAG
jgi:hypothetical protein